MRTAENWFYYESYRSHVSARNETRNSFFRFHTITPWDTYSLHTAYSLEIVILQSGDSLIPATLFSARYAHTLLRRSRNYLRIKLRNVLQRHNTILDGIRVSKLLLDQSSVSRVNARSEVCTVKALSDPQQATFWESKGDR